MNDAPREQWASRMGFVLAAVGSAVGLGNMWRFPYFAAENGGAAFVFLYLLMVALVGLPIMLAEFAIGRGSKKSPIQALEYFGGPAWKPLGVLFVLGGFLILSYYAVVAGWTLRYAWQAVVAGFGGDLGAFFGQAASGPDAVGWHIAFMLVTVTIVAGGIRGGIERSAVILMPLLFFIVVGLAIFAATLPGAGAGYAFYLKMDFSAILSFRVLTEATSQAFFSLSLGMGAMLTYSSYLSRDDNMPRESVIIAGSDFLIAFLAGLMVFPLIFALGLAGDVSEDQIGALFIALPGAFGEMGAVGRPVGILFFFALLVGALTSAISLLEVVVSAIIDNWSWPRRRAALVMGVLITLAGIPSALNTNVLGVVDQIAGNLILAVGALSLAIFVGWVMPDPIGEVRKGAEGVRWLPVWRAFLRYAVPPLLTVILYFSVRSTIGMIRGLFGG
ncbi:MAG: sodium-dependent transporter [Gemmatimonadota bacterium]|nr:MAG: sodium-dependent transporter [Gemmatimonadota bacterium]